MSAKLLHALSDENPDLHKQIGCMTGIFQLFDRNHILTPKRITSYSSHKRPPTGQPPFSNSNNGDDGHNVHYQHTSKLQEKNSSKNVTENHRISMESARASFSSSTCSSSFSSVDYNKTAQSETSSFDRSINSELPSREPSSMPANASSQSNKSSGFRDVVKDSIYKEARSLSVKTTAKEEPVSRVMKHRDSPRPLQPSRSVDGSAERGLNVKQWTPSDVKDSMNALSKLQETPRYFHDTREPARSSYEGRERGSFPVQKDTPRFSYDGREASRSSFESRDTFKSTAKLRELPRLSLDSRASSMRGSDSDAKSNSFMRDFGRGNGNANRTLSPQPGSENQKQNHSVVAKLMGLEAMPKALSTNEGHTGQSKSGFHPGDNLDSLSRSSRTSIDSKQNSRSPRNTLKEPISPQLKHPDPFMKPLSSPRFPIEPAPWKQIDAVHCVQKPAFRSRDSPPRGTTSPSVYAEIEKRLKELEFKQSDKDLRALKQILDAMQAKGLLEKKKEDRGFVSERNYDDPKQNILDQNLRFGRRSPAGTNHVSSANKVTSSPRTLDSPIVIMKPAKYIEKSVIPASSVIPIDGISSLRRLRNGNSMENKKSLVNNRMNKDLPPKVNLREPVKKPLNSTEKKASTRNIKSPNSPVRTQPLPRENLVSSGRISGSISPRLPQRKVDIEKQSRPTTPSSDLNKPRRVSPRQATDSGSPGGRRKLKSLNLQQSDDQLSEVSGDTRNTSRQGDEISVRSDSNVSLASQIDTEVTSADRSNDINNAWSPSRKVVTNMISSLKQKKLSPRLSEEGSVVEFTTIAPEQPSPVSVLDASFYSDDLPSPERKISEPNLLDTKELILSAEISRKKLENVEQLVQKLRRLNSNHDEATTDYIGSLCENTNPDHRYISEILLASGLLLRDLGSGLTTIQLHKSGYLINPDLFFVLEQTKASNGFSKDRHRHEHAIQSKSNQEKIHRRLVFDLVNEILEVKLASNELYHCADKLAGKTLNGQQLLKELCSEVEQLQTNENSDWGYDDADDFLKDILCKDVMSQTEKWAEFHKENSGIVLDVERLLFKDLIDEIISGEAASNLQAKPGRRCRQLFANEILSLALRYKKATT